MYKSCTTHDVSALCCNTLQKSLCTALILLIEHLLKCLKGKSPYLSSLWTRVYPMWRRYLAACQLKCHIRKLGLPYYKWRNTVSCYVSMANTNTAFLCLWNYVLPMTKACTLFKNVYSSFYGHVLFLKMSKISQASNGNLCVKFLLNKK